MRKHHHFMTLTRSRIHTSNSCPPPCPCPHPSNPQAPPLQRCHPLQPLRPLPSHIHPRRTALLPPHTRPPPPPPSLQTQRAAVPGRHQSPSPCRRRAAARPHHRCCLPRAGPPIPCCPPLPLACPPLRGPRHAQALSATLTPCPLPRPVPPCPPSPPPLSSPRPRAALTPRPRPHPHPVVPPHPHRHSSRQHRPRHQRRQQRPPRRPCPLAYPPRPPPLRHSYRHLWPAPSRQRSLCPTPAQDPASRCRLRPRTAPLWHRVLVCARDAPYSSATRCSETFLPGVQGPVKKQQPTECHAGGLRCVHIRSFGTWPLTFTCLVQFRAPTPAAWAGVGSRGGVGWGGGCSAEAQTHFEGAPGAQVGCPPLFTVGVGWGGVQPHGGGET